MQFIDSNDGQQTELNFDKYCDEVGQEIENNIYVIDQTSKSHLVSVNPSSLSFMGAQNYVNMNFLSDLLYVSYCSSSTYCSCRYLHQWQVLHNNWKLFAK